MQNPCALGGVAHLDPAPRRGSHRAGPRGTSSAKLEPSPTGGLVDPVARAAVNDPCIRPPAHRETFLEFLGDDPHRSVKPVRSGLLFGSPRRQTQFSVLSPGTRSKCWVLFVTNVNPNDRA